MRRCAPGLVLALAAAAACLAAEKDDAAARFDRIRPQLHSRDQAERQKAYDAYLAAGDEGRKQLVTELLTIRAAALAACREPYLSNDTQDKLLASHKNLDDARKEALRVIFDRKIYPDADHGRVGQPVVDKAVDAVKAIYPQYRHLLDPVVRRFARIPRAYDRLKEIDAVLARCNARDAELNPPLEKLAGLRPELLKLLLDLAAYADACDRGLRYNAQIRTTLSDAERTVIDLTNEYRMQLGLKPLAVSEPLVQAARKHSQEMAALRYFSHTSPKAENRDPGLRCRNEGYANFAGENCATAMGPDAAFKGWYNSSGHHRNMLNPRANEIGVGCAGPWTEDFGARPGLDLDVDNPPRTAKPAPPREPKKK